MIEDLQYLHVRSSENVLKICLGKIPKNIQAQKNLSKLIENSEGTILPGNLNWK